jgi:hypothetical protein
MERRYVRRIFLSLRHCLHHLYGVARTLSWLHFLPLALLALAIFPLTGCGDKHENKPDPVRRYATSSLAPPNPFPRWKEPVRSMPTMKRP